MPPKPQLINSQAEYRAAGRSGAKRGRIGSGQHYDKRAGAARHATGPVSSGQQAYAELAEINSGYTQVTAPFDGVVTARRRFRSANMSAPTTRRPSLPPSCQLDPIYVNFNVSEQDVLRMRDERAERGDARQPTSGNCPVEVGLQTESGYPHEGKLDYVAPTVNPVDRNAGGARPGPAIRSACCCPASSCAFACRSTAGAMRCWCRTWRSAAIRAAATCWWSMPTMWSSSARSTTGPLDGDLRVIENGLNAG